jgi:hypothetical protein
MQIRLGTSPPTLKSMNKNKKKQEASLFVKLTRKKNDLIYFLPCLDRLCDDLVMVHGGFFITFPSLSSNEIPMLV